MIWILVGYMWLFLHRPFEIWPIFATIRIERVYMIFTLFAWFAFSAKTWTNNRNNAALLLVAFSIFISTLLSPYDGLGDNKRMENWFKVFVFFLLVMTSVKSEKDLKILVTAFSVCFFIYMLHSFREFRCGKGVYRMGIWRMTGAGSADPNSFGNGINYALVLLLPLFVLVRSLPEKKKRRYGYLFIGASFLLSVYCILMTGSRSSFAVLGFSLFALAMMSKYRMRILPVLLIASPLAWFALPDSLQNRFWTIIDPSVGPANAQASAEGRWEGFYGGLAVWRDNLPFGVGPGCYATASGSGFQTHNLIGQVASELGTLGMIAYLSLIGAMLSNYITARSIRRQMKRQGREKEIEYLYAVVFVVSWTVLLLFFLGFGGHNAFRFTWVWYAAFQAIAVGLMRQKAVLQPGCRFT